MNKENQHGLHLPCWTPCLLNFIHLLIKFTNLFHVASTIYSLLKCDIKMQTFHHEKVKMSLRWVRDLLLCRVWYCTDFFPPYLSLHKIEVFGCLALTSRSIGTLVLQCPHLQTLNIGRVPKVSEACLLRGLENLQEVTALNVAGLKMVRLLGFRLTFQLGSMFLCFQSIKWIMFPWLSRLIMK